MAHEVFINRALVRKHFPRAKIVAGRFHVIRVIQKQFTNLIRELAPHIKHHRGALAALTASRCMENLFSSRFSELYDELR